MAILISAFMRLSFLMLAGTNSDSQVGRYRMSVITRNNFTDIFVIDTAAGVVKDVGADEGKPFSGIEGK